MHTSANTPVILLHVEAPAKPRAGEACNGCGVCCNWQPCPLGMLVSRRRQGACVALVWEADAALYRCGMISAPADQLPRLLRPLAPVLTPLLARLARRWIASGIGCDSNLETEAEAEPENETSVA